MGNLESFVGKKVSQKMDAALESEIKESCRESFFVLTTKEVVEYSVAFGSWTATDKEGALDTDDFVPETLEYDPVDVTVDADNPEEALQEAAEEAIEFHIPADVFANIIDRHRKRSDLG